MMTLFDRLGRSGIDFIFHESGFIQILRSFKNKHLNFIILSLRVLGLKSAHDGSLELTRLMLGSLRKSVLETGKF